MNPAATIEQTMPTGLNEALTLVGLPSRRPNPDLASSTVEIFAGIQKVLDNVLVMAIDSREVEGFKATRDKVFPDYFKTTAALSNLARVIVPRQTLKRIEYESFSELEGDLREHGLARFGSVARDQAVFTVWTMRKTARLSAMVISAGPLPPDRKEEDIKLAKEFNLFSRWSQFHLDCLIASIRFDKAIQPEVLDEICDGLRCAVNAYGLIRQAVDLRIPQTEPNIAPYEWDDEDQELLESSMNEIALETDSL